MTGLSLNVHEEMLHSLPRQVDVLMYLPMTVEKNASVTTGFLSGSIKIFRRWLNLEMSKVTIMIIYRWLWVSCKLIAEPYHENICICRHWIKFFLRFDLERRIKSTIHIHLVLFQVFINWYITIPRKVSVHCVLSCGISNKQVED